MRSGREETGATTATGGRGVRKQWERADGRGGEGKGEVLRGQRHFSGGSCDRLFHVLFWGWLDAYLFSELPELGMCLSFLWLW